MLGAFWDLSLNRAPHIKSVSPEGSITLKRYKLVLLDPSPLLGSPTPLGLMEADWKGTGLGSFRS